MSRNIICTIDSLFMFCGQPLISCLKLLFLIMLKLLFKVWDICSPLESEVDPGVEISRPEQLFTM